jgi:hypothetical protein
LLVDLGASETGQNQRCLSRDEVTSIQLG